jgi:nucleotide-binding universal stress UspA family protein
MEDYLLQLAGKLPPGTTVHVQAHVSDGAASLIIEHAREEQADVIVMATRSRQGISHLLFGSTTEEVVRSGVAPVLVVHPTATK